MTSRNATTDHITWTSANYVSNVGGPGEDSVWTYGPNRQVYKSYQAGPGGDETTYHVGKLFELVTFGGNSSNYRHYIMAGNELVAIYSRTFLGVNTLNYIQSDHQGSIASITTSTPATPYVNESFTAFGDRRNGETWSGAPTTADETAINAKSRWGYTGHTAIGVNMGLVHMNGRIEDAVIGRFMSPDPRGTIRGNTQSWNRYSYVNNNPLRFTDPTGFTCFTPTPDSPLNFDYTCDAGAGNHLDFNGLDPNSADANALLSNTNPVPGDAGPAAIRIWQNGNGTFESTIIRPPPPPDPQAPKPSPDNTTAPPDTTAGSPPDAPSPQPNSPQSIIPPSQPNQPPPDAVAGQPIPPVPIPVIEQPALPPPVPGSGASHDDDASYNPDDD